MSPQDGGQTTIRVVSAYSELINHAITADGELFIDAEKKMVERFHDLPLSAQYLYIRLFYRKPRCFTRHDYERYFGHSYGTSVKDIQLLQKTGFFETDDKIDLPMILKSLTADQLRAVVESSAIKRIRTQGGKKPATEKQKLLQRLDDVLCNRRITDTSGLDSIKQSIDTVLGPVCLLERTAQRGFQLMICCTLAACHVSVADLFRWAKLDYKPMALDRAVLHNNARLFLSRDQLQEYFVAVDLASVQDQQNWTTPHQWNKLYPEVVAKAQAALEALKDDLTYVQVVSVSQSLRKYSANAVYFSLLLAIAENIRDAEKETVCLDLFLAQDLYYPEKRPKALLRKFQTALVIYSKNNLDENFSRCLDICIELRFNPYLSDVEQLEFERKAKRLNDICRPQDKEVMTEIRSEIHAKVGSLKTAREIPLQSARVDLNNVKDERYPGQGRPTRWMSNEVASTVAFPDEHVEAVEKSSRGISVETVALNHYRKQQWQGVHSENSIVCALFFLLFWDIIYDQSKKNVFYHRYQPYPLDLQVRTEFYAARKVEIDTRLDAIASSISFALSHISDAYNQHINTLCGCTYWQFALEDMLCIAEGMGPQGLRSICSRLAKDHRTYRSGAPDLVLWNHRARKCKFVEVKSDNDTLSDNQRIYIHDLLSSGVDVELCKVRCKPAPKSRVTKRKR